MERSPRGAGVRPRTGASMGHYHTLRSFVISLVIAIAINKSPASGFTVPRDMLDLTPDMDTGESKLEVKYDLKTLRSDESINTGKIKEVSDSTVIAIKNLENNNKLNYSHEKVNEIHLMVNETIDTKTKILENRKTEMPFDTTTIISTETDSNFFTTSAPSDFLTTTSEPIITTGSEIDNFNEYLSFTGATEDLYSIGNESITAKQDTKNTSNNVNISNTGEKKSNVLNNMFKNAAEASEHTSTVLITTITNTESTTENDFLDQKPDLTKLIEENMTADTNELHRASMTEVPTEVTGEATTDNSDDFPTDSYSSTLPPWKKYTTIDRKHTSTKTSITTEKDMVLAETAQTRISIEKMLTTTPRIETNASVATDAEISKQEIVSKRAGFKDNRDTRVIVNNTEIYDYIVTSTESETETSEVDVTNNKNGSIYGSQSQLADDAIKEELLREKTLNDNEDNANFKHIKQVNMNFELGSVTEPEEMLSVKPIGQEKKKHTILYAVSPNYKPLKKIDVQPPKPFVRDPDDNSWRNESISSLGIVFKPKNASKSFTEVLKNKTETELGNIAEKDSKGDLPDLRDRLEKIAEVRKSKKRINKFGDTVYSDYEESGESANLFKEDATTPITPSVKSILTVTPTPSPNKAFDLMVNAITKEYYNIFKSEKTTPITTYKPKKYNLAEYYDASDDYDADYVNQHKIDLKKFTKPMTTKEDFATQPPELVYTQPITEHQPMRMATLQYFPPRPKIVQKVNMNDYDTNFNKKVNLYDFDKPRTKNVISTSFGTVSPITTENNEPLNKVTMKPAYTPMYETDNLNKNLYLTNQQRVSEPPPGELVGNDGNFNRASYVIKHYRDFINEAVKEGEDERSDYTFTESPVHGITVNELAKINPGDNNQGEEDYEYDVKFRKDVMNRFVDNFNQNSERFKVSFPILYNSSIVHGHTPEHGRVASSSAFMKRLYEVANPRSSNYQRKMCDPHCDKIVELTPAYELHYYVPDEEEKEEIQPQASPPYRYRL